MNAFGQPGYGITRSLPAMDHDAAIEQVTAALKEQGFGVLTTIDMTGTLQAKIGVDLGLRYTILGACNPPMAHAAIQADAAIGLLLPCNVVVTEEADGSTVVSAIDPAKMFTVVDNPAMGPVVTEVTQRLTAALESLPSA